ncbi:MAG TPA: CrcB family protein [Fibrobacteria bacterium]|jgi:CrcB protein|nr:CrcB family protein [Fibrobacteria bacterium]
MPFLALIGVALGGAAGSVARYAVQVAFRLHPTGTLAINLAGSFLIGLCAAWAERDGAPWIRPWLMTGFLGGFTTFSAFSLENFRMLRDGHATAAILYAGTSVAGGVALAFAGYALARPAGA